jgi:hypothetical protein
MIPALWIIYVGFFALVVGLSLFKRRFRRSLRWADVLFVIVPFLIWSVLASTAIRPKGLTDGEVELSLLGLSVGLTLVARSTLSRRKVNVYAWILSAVFAFLLWALKPPFSHFDLLGAHLYAKRHPELSADMRESIIKGVVVKGMTADQAYVTGGWHAWTSRGGQLSRLDFYNLSQFGTTRPVLFVAYFADGQVSEVERRLTPESCREFASNPTPESIDYPYTGFWKTDCSNDFGLRFNRGGAGIYAVRFCGPGGCGDIRCTRVPDGRAYQVIDASTLMIEDTEKYQRCESQSTGSPN